MNKDEIDNQEMLHIEMAARGCVGNTAAEWPYLRRALKNRGIDLPMTANAQEMRDVCVAYLKTLGDRHE